MGSLSLASPLAYHEVDESLLDQELRAAIQRCAREQQRAARAAMQSYRRCDPQEVSQATLQSLVAGNREIRGIATERDITNAIPFNSKNVVGAVRDGAVLRLRRAIDARVARRIGALFVEGEDPIVVRAGQYWYPPGSYMGWHTNSRFPGWRLYVTYCAEPEKSFFRYRDPDSGEIVTSTDRQWHVRMFRVSADKLLWHCVYSDTDRLSIGYVVRPWSLRDAVIRRARYVLVGYAG